MLLQIRSAREQTRTRPVEVTSCGCIVASYTRTTCNGDFQASSPTVQQLVDEHKVVLDVLLADLAKVGRHDVAHLVQELEHHGGVDILLGDGRQPDVGALDVEEAGAGDVGDRGAHLLPGVDHVDAEGVHGVPPGTRQRERQRGFSRVFSCWQAVLTH